MKVENFAIQNFCRACGHSLLQAEIQKIDGFLENCVYDCASCVNCGTKQTSIGDEAQLNGMYDAIYQNSAVISGYKRYDMYGRLSRSAVFRKIFDIVYAERIYHGAYSFVKNESKKSGRKLKILEIGSGLGYTTARLRKMGHNVIGCDLSSDACARAANLHGGEFICGTVSEVQRLHGDTFDCVVCLEVIEHVDSPHQLLHDLKSILGRDGCIILSTPNLRHSGGWDTTEPPIHCTYFTIGGVRALISKIDAKGEIISYTPFRSDTVGAQKPVNLPGAVLLKDYLPNKKYFDYGTIPVSSVIKMLIKNIFNRFYYRFVRPINISSIFDKNIKNNMTSIIVKISFIDD
jgi:2-polyprenyl-3-methyl-5-hydroxy-6-metoxy-1,4-benzoquinol methylase